LSPARKKENETMTTRQIIAEAKARGFRFVGTAAGRIPLAEFDPYGMKSNPRRSIRSWAWRSWTQAADGPRPTLAGMCTGIWTFYTTETDFC
jgi:hypothetical protein